MRFLPHAAGAIVLGLCGLLIEPCKAAGSSTVNAATDSRGIVVIVHTESPDLVEGEVQKAISAELGVPVLAADAPEASSARGVVTITYRPANKELAVTYFEEGRGSVTRVVPGPDKVADVPGMAALLAGDLVRNEAREILGTARATVPPPPPTPTVSPPASASPPPAPPPKPLPYRAANAAVFFPLATNGSVPNLRTSLDLNLVYGRIGQLDGFSLGTVNAVAGDANGAEFALLTNLVDGRLRGWQAALVYNHARRVDGFQLTLGVNRSDEKAEGGQGAVGVNLAPHGIEGFQVGLVNDAGAHSEGVQAGGLLNVSQAGLTGMEVTPGVNVAGDVRGAQIGLINVAGRVTGAQIGLINVADDVDGVPIGLVSVSRTGGVHPMAWASNTTYANVGVKFATRYTYTLIDAGSHYDGDRWLYGGGLAIGTSIPILPHTFVDFDVGGSHLFASTDCCRDRFLGAIARRYDRSFGKVRAILRQTLAPHVSLFAGTGVTGIVTYPLRGNDTEVKLKVGPELLGGVEL